MPQQRPRWLSQENRNRVNWERIRGFFIMAKSDQAFDSHSQDAATDGWTKPQGGHIPKPTYMPVVLALGLVCLLWGIVTTYLISLVGLVIFVVGIWGWIGDLRHERGNSGAD